MKATYPNQLDYAESTGHSPRRKKRGVMRESNSRPPAPNHTVRLDQSPKVTQWGTVSECLRRQIRNLLGSARASSNLVGVASFFWFSLSGTQSLVNWVIGLVELSIPASGAGGREFDSRITPFLSRHGEGLAASSRRHRVRVVKEVD